MHRSKRFCFKSFKISLFGLVLCFHVLAQSSQNLTDSLTLNQNFNRLGLHTFFQQNALVWNPLKDSVNQLQVLASNTYIWNTVLQGDQFVTRDHLLFVNFKRILPFKNFYLPADIQINDFRASKTNLSRAMVGVGKTFFTNKTQTEIELLAGGVYDSRILASNQGLGIDFRGRWLFNSNGVTPFTIGVLGRNQFYNISPRAATFQQVETFLEKRFNSNAELTAGAGIKLRRAEDYLQNVIQSIRSDTLTARLGIRYRISENWQVVSQNQWSQPNRFFNYRVWQSGPDRQNTQYIQDEYQLRQELRYLSPKLRAIGAYEFRLRNRDYNVTNNLDSGLRYLNTVRLREKIKDIREATTAYTYDIIYNPTAKHTLKLNTLAQLLRVDTWSPENNQDRDELVYSGEINWEYRPFWGFVWGQKFSGSFRHIVFINADQSIENFKERILRYEPWFRWVQGPLTLSTQYSIFVTYHVRDYEAEQLKNRSNRVWLIQSAAVYRFNPKWSLQTDWTRRENRLSFLNWEKFSESPIDTVVIHDFTFKANKKFFLKNGPSINTSFGYRFFRQSRRSESGIENAGPKTGYINQLTWQFGPVLNLSATPHPRFSLTGYIWLQSTQVFNIYKITNLPWAGSTQTQLELSRRTGNFWPMFSLSFQWVPS